MPAAIPRSPLGSGHSAGTYQEPEVALKEQHVPGLQLPECTGAVETTPPSMPGQVLMQCPLWGWVTVRLRLDGDCGRGVLHSWGANFSPGAASQCMLDIFFPNIFWALREHLKFALLIFPFITNYLLIYLTNL